MRKVKVRTEPWPQDVGASSAMADLDRVIALLAAAEPIPLRRVEFVALCHLLAMDPSRTWEDLAPNYNYTFDPGPSSSRLASGLDLLVDARYVVANSSMTVTPAGKRALKNEPYGAYLLGRAQGAINQYRLSGSDLVDASVDRARTLVDLYSAGVGHAPERRDGTGTPADARP